ncbi:MAG: thiamine-phosphate synthase family protein [bacterium]
MTSNREEILSRLRSAVAILESCPEFALLIPEVRSNVAFCTAKARTLDDVAAVDGRITVVSGKPKASGPVCFGASDHLARLILTLRQHQPTIRTALNFRWNESILNYVTTWAAHHGKQMGVIDRKNEPDEVIGRDKMSIPWKVKELLAGTGGLVPEIFYETRGWGKEPLFIIIGNDPIEIVQEVTALARGYAQIDRK